MWGAYLVLVLVFLAASTPRLARADEKADCVSAYKDAQLRRKAGALRQAREQLLVCSSEACPAVVKADCVPWLGEVTRSIASILVTATGDDGSVRSDVTVRANGQILATSLDGRAIDVDPGDLVLRFEAPGLSPFVKKVHLAEGERDRRIPVTFSALRPAASGTLPAPAPESAPEPAANHRPVPAAAIALGAVAVAGGAGFAAFGAVGSSALKPLAACKPSCSTASDAHTLSAAKRDYILADVSLGVGVVSLALATYFFLTRPTVADEATSIDVRVTSGGVFVSRTFAW